MGSSISLLLQQSIGTSGGVLFSFVMSLIGVSLVMQISWLDLIEKLGEKVESIFLGSSGGNQ